MACNLVDVVAHAVELVHAGVLRLTLSIGVLCTGVHGLGAHILGSGLKAAFNAELGDALFSW